MRSRLHERLITELKERYEAQLKEKERIIDVLAEQVDFLRNQLGQANLAHRQSANPTEQPAMLVDASPFLSEDEEDMLAMHAAGHLSDDQLKNALAQVGFLNDQIDVSS
jgi:hypothetical protein